MQNFFNQQQQQQYAFGQRLRKMWTQFYDVNNIQTQKGTQNSFLPSTPIIAALGQLNDTLTNMESKLSTRLPGEDEASKTQRVGSEIKREYEKLIDQYQKLSQAGVLTKEHSLQSLLENKPLLNAYIRNNVLPKNISELLTLAQSDPTLNELLPGLLEQYPNKLSSKKTAKGSAAASLTSGPTQNVSVSDGKSELLQRVGQHVKGFKNFTGLKNLPDHLQIEYAFLLDEMDKNLDNEKDAEKLVKSVGTFLNNLDQDAVEMAAANDKTDMFIDSSNVSNMSSIKPSAKPNNNNDDDDQQQGAVYFNERDPDYYSQANLTVKQSNNQGEELPASPMSAETEKYITQLENLFARIPPNAKKYEKTMRSKNAIINELIRTDKPNRKEGAIGKTRNEATDRAKDFLKSNKKKATLPTPSATSAATSEKLTAEALSKVGEGKPKKKKSNKDVPKKRKISYDKAKFKEPNSSKVKQLNSKTVKTSIENEEKQITAKLNDIVKKVKQLNSQTVKPSKATLAQKSQAKKAAMSKGLSFAAANKNNVSFVLPSNQSNLPRGITFG